MKEAYKNHKERIAEKAEEIAKEKISEAKVGGSFFAENNLWKGSHIDKIKDFSVEDIYHTVSNTVEGYYKISDPNNIYSGEIKDEEDIYLTCREKLDFVYNSNYMDSTVYNAMIARLQELGAEKNLNDQLN